MTQLKKQEQELQEIIKEYFSMFDLSDAVENITELLFHFAQFQVKLKAKKDGGFTDTYFNDTIFRTKETITLINKLYENVIKKNHD